MPFTPLTTSSVEVPGLRDAHIHLTNFEIMVSTDRRVKVPSILLDEKRMPPPGRLGFLIKGSHIDLGEMQPWKMDRAKQTTRYRAELQLPERYKNLSSLTISSVGLSPITIANIGLDKLHVEGWDGPVLATNCKIPGKLYITATRGNIELRNCTLGEGNFSTVSGDVTLRNVTAPKTAAETTTGTIALHDCAIEHFEPHTSQGRIRVNGKHYTSTQVGRRP